MKTIDAYRKFIEQVKESSGIASLTPDDSGLVSVRVDDAYNVNLQFVEATGKILCFVEVVQLPPDAPQTVYRAHRLSLRASGLMTLSSGTASCRTPDRYPRL